MSPSRLSTDLDEDVGEASDVVSFTVAGISRRGLNDPQFQRITLEPHLKHGISDISVRLPNLAGFLRWQVRFSDMSRGPPS